MTFNLAACAGGFIATVAFTGCALVYEGKYDWYEGWREAEVLKVGNAAEMGKPQFSDCRKDATPEQLPKASSLCWLTGI